MKRQFLSGHGGTLVAWAFALVFIVLVALIVGRCDAIIDAQLEETGKLIVGLVVIPIGIAFTFLAALAGGAMVAAWLLPAFDCEHFVKSTGSTGRLASMIRFAAKLGRKIRGN